MQVALLITFSASKKEPLAVLLERIHTAFLTSGLGEPAIQFSFSDAPVAVFTSGVDRVLKRYPDLQRWLSTGPTTPGGPPIRQISNVPASPAAGKAVEFATLLAVAASVPRSFPLHNLWVHFQAPAFGVELPVRGPRGSMT